MKYEAYPAYSDTCLEWLGAVPQHWRRLPLKRKFRIVNGSTPGASEPDYWDGDILWITPADFRTSRGGYLETSGRRITLRGLNSCGTSLVPKNSIVLTTRAPIGGVAQVRAEFCINQGCKSLALDAAGVWERFVYFVLDVSSPQLNALGLGSTFMELSTDDLGMYSVPLPPLPEQQQIAAFLDWKTGQIDALIARKQELLEKLKEKRLAVITQAVTRGLNPAAPLRDSGIPWLGHVPAHWDVIPLGFLVTMSGGLTPSMANSEYWGGDIPWVTPKDMKQSRISDSIEHVTEKALEETAIALIPINTVLVVVRGMILAHSFPTALTEKPLTINQDMKALRAGEKLEVDYLFWCLTGFGKVFSALAQASAHGTRKMETETIKKFAYPVPPRDEQRAIARHLEEEMNRLDDLWSTTESTINRLTEYRTALITAATTGKIDVRSVRIPQPG